MVSMYPVAGSDINHAKLKSVSHQSQSQSRSSPFLFAAAAAVCTDSLHTLQAPCLTLTLTRLTL
jgi:hypothetical protein